MELEWDLLKIDIQVWGSKNGSILYYAFISKLSGTLVPISKTITTPSSFRSFVLYIKWPQLDQVTLNEVSKEVSAEKSY